MLNVEHNLTQKRKWLIIFLHQRARQAFDFEQSIKLVGRKKKEDACTPIDVDPRWICG